MAKLFSARIWILIIVIVLSILAISPRPWAEGIEITSVEKGSLEAENGISEGEIIKEINNVKIDTLNDYKTEIEKLKREPVKINLLTDKGNISYESTGDIKIRLDENLTIIYFDKETEGIELGMKVLGINNKEVKSLDEFNEIVKEIIPKQKFILKTNKKEYSYFIFDEPKLKANIAKTTNIVKGLDLAGGTRVLLQPETKSGEEVTDSQVSDLIDVLTNRLNIYGLADLKIRAANDLEQNKFVLIEIAGISREEVREVLAKQGKFEAKIGEELVFSGGEEDITFVCRNDGSCAGIRPPCSQISDEQWFCKFEFAIHLSGEAAKRHAEVTGKLSTNKSESGGEYLSKNIDFYLDDKEVDSLLIAADLKGKEATQIAISGPGYGRNEAEAYSDALKSMNRLQTILITGSLPLKLNIVKLDTISPMLGSRFIKNAVLVGIFALISVAIVLFIRYRSFKILIPIMITSVSEVIITLGVAALIKWNLDLAAIAGIIAAVGTGVDDQIVMTDEILKGEVRYLNWKEKIKRAFFIIMSAYFATVAAMIPLWFAGAGLIRGFAVTTIIGITAGVLITRPAFASIAERLFNK